MNTELQAYWWELPKEKLHETIFGIVRFLDTHQNFIDEMNLRHLRLYGNLNVLGLSTESYSVSANTTDRVTLNIVQSCCDTVTNKIAKNKPKPTFLTSGGDYKLKRKAKKLEKFVQGQFEAVQMYAKAPFVFKDGAVFGTGALKIFREGDEIKAERTFISELKVHLTEAMHGNPRSLYQVKVMPREVMAKLYPKFADKIKQAKRAEQGSSPSHANLSNNILVVEAWHLPSAKGAKDGRHAICIENATLMVEGWERDYFPFVFSRWSQRLLGFWGQGLAEQLTGTQVEINKILRTIQLAFHLCVPKMMVEQGSKVVPAHLNNEIGGILKYFGTKPEWVHFQSVHPELFAHLERLYQKAYEIAGISQLAAQSKKPAGLDSGKALREFNDIESERFMLVGQAWEQFFMESARQLVDLAKEIFLEKGEYAVTVKGRKFIETIDWAEVDLADDQYSMQIFPTSLLSSTPSGRLQDVQDLIQAGFIDKANGLRLLDFPDLESYTSLANAAIEDIEAMIEAMVDRGEYMPPEPFQDLALGVKMMQSAYLKAKADNVEEEHLELLRRWMEEANAKLTPPAPPASAPGVAGSPEGLPAGPELPGASPQAVPAAPPVSDLLPNAPGGMA